VDGRCRCRCLASVGRTQASWPGCGDSAAWHQRFPAAKEHHDGVLVDIGAKQGCSSTRAERTGADELGIDAGAAVAGVGSMLRGVGDESRFDGGPVVDTGVVIVEHVEWSGWCGVVCEKLVNDAA
jgi:hypothetical protein